MLDANSQTATYTDAAGIPIEITTWRERVSVPQLRNPAVAGHQQFWKTTGSLPIMATDRAEEIRLRTTVDWRR